MNGQELALSTSTGNENQDHKVIIVNTLNGQLHGIDSATGSQLWTIQDNLGPMVQVHSTEKSNDQDRLEPLRPHKNNDESNRKKDGMFIPELSGGVGSLYYYEAGGEVKQLRIPLKQIINDHSVFINDGYVFTGKKITHVLALDPKTGRILQTYGEGLNGIPNQSKLPKNAIFVGRTQYYLNIWDKDSSVLKWNITYGEYTPANIGQSENPKTSEKSKALIVSSSSIYADDEGKIFLKNKNDKSNQGPVNINLGSPLVSAFEISPDGQVILKSSQSKRKSTDLAFIGELDGSVYLMTGDSLPVFRDTKYSDSKDLILAKSFCAPGYPGFPRCLQGIHKVTGLIDGPKTSASLFQQTYQNFYFWIYSGILGLLLMIILWLAGRLRFEYSKERKIETEEKSITSQQGLQALQISDVVLGTGSHGTVVYQGCFEGRPVAIKRLLLDFFDVADHEVQILKDSDYHPNVIRYFYKEVNQGFMYLALELCPASLYDVIENTDSEDLMDIQNNFDPKLAAFQILSGIKHLHQLKIVHRDIKPQNILVADTKKHTRPRFLISDFGLGKRLEEEQSFFHVSHTAAGGTQGWRAPEAIEATNKLRCSTEDAVLSGPKSLHEHRITKAVDIFSAGCVLYYILTKGSHPFGDKFSRERNILKGNMMLEKLDNIQDGVLARDLIKRMISFTPARRPSADEAIAHPFFWSPSVRLAFLQDVSDRLEGESKDPLSPLLTILEKKASKILKGKDWYSRLDPGLVETLGKYRRYDGSSVQDLMRVIRNKKHHYAELPVEVQETVGILPDGYLNYFMKLFPDLLTNAYYLVVNDPELSKESIFQQYLSSENQQSLF